MLRQHCPRMTNPGAIGEADHLDEQIANSFGSKELSSLKSSKVPAPMPPEGCPEPHHAEVVACDLFATPNSLKSRVARKVLSPFSNIHAVTPKLRTHSTSTAIQNQWTSNLRAALNFQKSPLRRQCPTSRDFVPWRFSAAGRFSAGRVSLLPAAENLHISGSEQMQQIASLFDHLVGGGEQRRRHGQAEHAGGLRH